MTPNANRPTRSEQREAARAKAREIRDAHKKQEKVRKVGLISGVIASVLVFGGLIGWLVVANQPAPALTPVNAMFNDGIRVGTGIKTFTPEVTPNTADVPVVKIYMDYQCPICQMFEVPNSALIRNKVNSGEWIVEYHPISFLDGRGSPNTYSSRAANAAMCVAEHSPNDFMTYTSLLYANQPAEQTPGPENDKLIAFANQVGVQNESKIADCVNNKSYGAWIQTATNKALSEKVPGTDLSVQGTPFIVVGKQNYTWNTQADLGSPARFEQWVAAAWEASK